MPDIFPSDPKSQDVPEKPARAEARLADGAPIRLGTFLPLTGLLAPRGRPALEGLQACLQRVNDDGGVYGHPLELVVLDDEFDPIKTVPAVQHLVEVEQVFCLVAPLGTQTNKVVLNYLELSGVPVVAPLSGSTYLSMPPKRNYFALQVNYVVEGTLLARHALETLQSSRIAIFHSDDDFGQEGARAFLAELARFDVRPVKVEMGWQDDLAAGVIVERLKAAQPDTVLIYSHLNQAAALLQEAERQSFRPRWLGSYVLCDSALFDLAGMQATEGMTVGQMYIDPLGPDPQAESYRADLKHASPAARPGTYSASGYTAACLVVEGLHRACPALSRQAFIAALENLQDWRGGLVSGISYTRTDRRGAKRLSLARAVQGRWVTQKPTLALRDRLLTITAPLALQVNILTRQVMEQLGKERIRQKAIDVAQQCAIFIHHHPGMDLNDMQASQEFQRIAVQPLGLTGYTALYGPAPEPKMRMHPNPDLINVNLTTTDRPKRFPDWWRLYQYSLSNGGQEGGGFYYWEDVDGIVRQKYQYFLPVEGTRYILGATTYLEEFFQPFEEAEAAISRTVNDLTAEIFRHISDPIQHIMEGVDRVSRGELDFEIALGSAEEAQWLAQAFNQMTHNLRLLSNRWAQLNQELEGRVADRTDELARANRQLQLSNRSLQEMNQQLSEAKTAAERDRLEAEEANRLKSRFLSNMSHELRTPLNAIINFSKLLLVGSEGPLSQNQTDFLERIRDSGDYLLGLLNDMLDLARIEAGKIELYREETNLAQVIQGVMSTAVGLTRDKPIQLYQQVASDLPAVWVDQNRVRQVLLNLLANAAKFTLRGHITVRAEPYGEYVLVSTHDSGPGIPKVEQARIFEAYVKGEGNNRQSNNQDQGAGLGLAISRQLVEMHGGTIWVESQPGEGSTFFFTLPVVPKEKPGRRLPGSQAQPLPARLPLVLVLDNDCQTYQCLKQPLSENGFRVAGWRNNPFLPNQLWQLQPAAVLLDIWEVQDAVRLANALHASHPELPLLAAGFAADKQQGRIANQRVISDTPEKQTTPHLGQGEFVRQVMAWVDSNTATGAATTGAICNER